LLLAAVDLAGCYNWHIICAALGFGAVGLDVLEIFVITAVRLEVEENQLVSVFGEIGILFDGLKGA
jgi:hypothetical protein